MLSPRYETDRNDREVWYHIMTPIPCITLYQRQTESTYTRRRLTSTKQVWFSESSMQGTVLTMEVDPSMLRLVIFRRNVWGKRERTWNVAMLATLVYNTIEFAAATATR